MKIKLLFAALIIIPVGTYARSTFSQALERSHQKKAMIELREIATAWEARAEDTKSYDVGKRNPSRFDMQRALVPKYIKQLPARDPWGRDYLFESTPAGYTIRSLGGNRLSPTDDVVYTNGSFQQLPAGVML